MPSELPPINFTEDKEKYQAKEFSVDWSTKVKCTHKDIKFVKGELRCKCGAAYSGPRLNELYNLLTKS